MSSNHNTSEIEMVKHPLEYPWSFWLFTNEIKNKNKWLDNLRELTDFDTVEDYWCLYHHMKLPSELRQGQDYAIFKRGISPTWEDAANKAGGRWLLHMDRRTELLDTYWLDVVLLMIGENFGDSNDLVSGAVVNVRDRARSKISIWTRNTDEKSNMVIGRTVKEQLRIKNVKLQFYAHNSTNALYTC